MLHVWSILTNIPFSPKSCFETLSLLQLCCVLCISLSCIVLYCICICLYAHGPLWLYALIKYRIVSYHVPTIFKSDRCRSVFDNAQIQEIVYMPWHTVKQNILLKLSSVSISSMGVSLNSITLFLNFALKIRKHKV